MRKIVQITVLTVVWLLASPTVHVPDSVRLEVGAPPAIANEVKPAKKKVRSSASIPQSVAPGLYPMRSIIAPEPPQTTRSVAAVKSVPGYEQVPMVPAGSAETVNDRIARCTHQGALGGLPPGEQGPYIHACAFNE